MSLVSENLTIIENNTYIISLIPSIANMVVLKDRMQLFTVLID